MTGRIYSEKAQYPAIDNSIWGMVKGGICCVCYLSIQRISAETAQSSDTPATLVSRETRAVNSCSLTDICCSSTANRAFSSCSNFKWSSQFFRDASFSLTLVLTLPRASTTSGAFSTTCSQGILVAAAFKTLQTRLIPTFRLQDNSFISNKTDVRQTPFQLRKTQGPVTRRRKYDMYGGHIQHRAWRGALSISNYSPVTGCVADRISSGRMMIRPYSFPNSVGADHHPPGLRRIPLTATGRGCYLP